MWLWVKFPTWKKTKQSDSDFVFATWKLWHFSDTKDRKGLSRYKGWTISCLSFPPLHLISFLLYLAHSGTQSCATWVTSTGPSLGFWLQFLGCPTDQKDRNKKSYRIYRLNNSSLKHLRPEVFWESRFPFGFRDLCIYKIRYLRWKTQVQTEKPCFIYTSYK